MGFFVMIAQRTHGMSFPRSVTAPTYRCAWLDRFTFSPPTLTSNVLASCVRWSIRMQPARLTITSATMFARIAALVAIPIDDRHCFTYRFSPTGFILNASDFNYCHPIALGSHSG